jgi:putative oxidoreductase
MARLLAALAPPATVPSAVAFLILRVVVGWSLHLHGAPKLHDPLHWLDDSPALHAALPGTPAFLEPVVAFAEGIGGLLIIVGFLTRIVTIFVICDLGVVVVGLGMLHGHPFVGGRQAYEIPALLLTVAIALLIAGPGRYSIDAILARRGAAEQFAIRR